MAGQPIVFLYRDERVERRAVKLGGVQGSNQEVIAGLSSRRPGGVEWRAEGLQDGRESCIEEVGEAWFEWMAGAMAAA